MRAYALRVARERVFSRVDVVASPTTAMVAPPILPDAAQGGESNVPLTADLMRYIHHGNFVRPEKSRDAHPFIQKGMPEVRRDKFREYHSQLSLSLTSIPHASGDGTPSASLRTRSSGSPSLVPGHR